MIKGHVWQIAHFSNSLSWLLSNYELISPNSIYFVTTVFFYFITIYLLYIRDHLGLLQYSSHFIFPPLQKFYKACQFFMYKIIWKRQKKSAPLEKKKLVNSFCAIAPVALFNAVTREARTMSRFLFYSGLFINILCRNFGISMKNVLWSRNILFIASFSSAFIA